MQLYRCFLLLALVMAVSACSLKRRVKPCHGHKKIGKPCSGARPKCGSSKCGSRPPKPKCGSPPPPPPSEPSPPPPPPPSEPSPPPPPPPSEPDYPFYSFAELYSVEIQSIYRWFTFDITREPSGLNEMSQLLIGMSWKLSPYIDEYILPGMGPYFRQMCLGIWRYVICGKGGSNSLAVCGRDFGKSWGCKSYTESFEFSDLNERFRLTDARPAIIQIAEKNGYDLKTMTGPKGLVINSCLRMANLVYKGVGEWDETRFIAFIRYTLTIFAGCARIVKSGLDITLMKEITPYIKSCWRRYNTNIDITEYIEIIITELRSCEKKSWKGVIVSYYNDDITGSYDNSNSQNNNSNTQNNNSDTQNNNSNTQNNDSSNTKGSSSCNKCTTCGTKQDDNASGRTVETTVVEYDEYFDENNNLVMSTKPN